MVGPSVPTFRRQDASVLIYVGHVLPELFVQELAVVLSGHQERELAACFEAGRQAYTRCSRRRCAGWT